MAAGIYVRAAKRITAAAKVLELYRFISENCSLYVAYAHAVGGTKRPGSLHEPGSFVAISFLKAHSEETSYR